MCRNSAQWRRTKLHPDARRGIGVRNALGRVLKNGAEGIRTLDPHVANVVLSQLSYCPSFDP